MFFEYHIENKDMEIQLGKEQKSYITKEKFRCLNIFNKKESIVITMTTEQAKELANTIYTKLAIEKARKEGVPV